VDFFALRAAIFAMSFWFSVSTGTTGAGGEDLFALRAAISAMSFWCSVSTGAGGGDVCDGQTPGFLRQNNSIFNFSLAVEAGAGVGANKLSNYNEACYFA
tara:strand:- start:148 stop:447 length:300 start_codon:yes stop_codon:yes gene_type:complete